MTRRAAPPCPTRPDGSLDIELRTLPGWEVTVYPSSVDPGVWVVWVRFHGICSRTGVEGHYEVRDTYRRRGGKPPCAMKAAHWARQTILRAMEHELLESLHVGGRRMFDPHAVRKKTVVVPPAPMLAEIQAAPSTVSPADFRVFIEGELAKLEAQGLILPAPATEVSAEGNRMNFQLVYYPPEEA